MVVCSVLSAVFLIITLAQFEAGTGAKVKWAGLTLFSLAVVAALLFFKPGSGMERAETRPVLPPAAGVESEPGEIPAKKTGTQSAGSNSLPAGETPRGMVSNVPAGGDGNKTGLGREGKTGEGKDVKTPAPKNAAAMSIQEQLGLSLQKKNGPGGKVDFKDPVLVEIQELKRQAEETALKEAALDNAALENSGDAGIHNYLRREQKAATGEKLRQAQEPSSNDGEGNSTGGDSGATQAEVRARVLVPVLNVRDRGTLDGQVIGQVRQDEVVAVTGGPDGAGWVEIRAFSGRTGWVMARYLQNLP
ncbi:MAG: SH3 domain-containing protein [Firmicutes bacterium]|nr:SH3 domain-containing protein [Bacillota bacterium]